MNDRIEVYGAKPADSGRVTEALRQIQHSIQQARIPGNDWRRELALIENTVDAAIAAQGQGAGVEYFAADPAGGEFTTYKTLPEARRAAEVSLGYAQDEALEGGWDDEPPQICYGIVLGGCVEKEGSRRPAPEGSDFSEMVDFRLTEPNATTAQPAGVPDGWKVEIDVGPEKAIHVTMPNGKWFGVLDYTSAREKALCDFFRAIAAAPSAPESNT